MQWTTALGSVGIRTLAGGQGRESLQDHLWGPPTVATPEEIQDKVASPGQGQGRKVSREETLLGFLGGASRGVRGVCTSRTLRSLHQGATRRALANSGDWRLLLSVRRGTRCIACQVVPLYLCIKCGAWASKKAKGLPEVCVGTPSRAGAQAIRRISVHKKHPTLELSVDQDGVPGLVAGPCTRDIVPISSAAERLEAIRNRVRARQAAYGPAQVDVPT